MLAMFGALGLLFSACSAFSSPQNTFAPAGEVAEDQKRWFLYAMWPALAIMIFVELGCVFIVLKFRKRKGHDELPKQIHGNNALEIGWSILPAVVLAFYVPIVVLGIMKLGDPPKDSIRVEVNAFQFGWYFGYPAADGTVIEGDPSSVSDPGPGLYVPLGKTIELRLHSDNVIHSFWVPKLAGKTDVMPGRNNYMWIKGDKLGDYAGQCAEFCGLSHAEMRFRVIAMERAEFDQWIADQGGTAIASNAPARVGVASSGE